MSGFRRHLISNVIGGSGFKSPGYFVDIPLPQIPCSELEIEYLGVKLNKDKDYSGYEYVNSMLIFAVNGDYVKMSWYSNQLYQAPVINRREYDYTNVIRVNSLYTWHKRNCGWMWNQVDDGTIKTSQFNDNTLLKVRLSGGGVHEKRGMVKFKYIRIYNKVTGEEYYHFRPRRISLNKIVGYDKERNFLLA